MLLVPEFWTRLIIFVDTHAPAIADLRIQLSASRNLPFRAHIFNRQESVYQDSTEGARVRAVVNELSPHLHRCEWLTFDVMHNSSLPSICRNFSGSYPLLTKLSMECKIHDIKPPEFNEEGEARRDPFLFPNLDRVTLTGSTFADAYNNPTWLRGTEAKKLGLFSISHLSSIDIPNFTLLGFLSVLNELVNISSLELKYVDLFQYPEEELPDDWDLRVSFDRVLLEGLNKDNFEEVNDLISTSDYESQTIRSCELSAGFINYSFYLNFEDIHSSDDLLSVIPTLSNHCVSFTSCRGFNDAILKQLSMPDPTSGMWSLETLQNLSISDCPGISVQALKDLVESRIVESAARGRWTNPNYDEFIDMAAINLLSISRRGLDFSLKDVQWFKEKVTYFTCWPSGTS